MSRRGRAARLLAATALGALLAALPASMPAALAATETATETATGTVAEAEAAADDQATIDYVEPSDEGLQVLVSVPAGAQVELDQVRATVDGEEAETTAAPTGETTSVKRTTMLAIDTSRSMSGERFRAARAAAATFLGSVPDDVEVGILTFDDDVELSLPPTTDRAGAREVLDGLTLSPRTMLYDGVLESVEALGDEGQRSILLLSDGADTSETPLAEVTEAVEGADVLLDVVALEQSATKAAALQDLARAGSGSVISADSRALRQTFARQAEALARQVLVTVPVPETVTASEADVEVALPSDDGLLTAKAYVTVAGAAGPDITVATEQAALALPLWAMYAGVGGVGLGILVLLLMLVPRKQAALTAEDRITRYARGANASSDPEDRPAESEDALSSAKEAAASMLQRNRGLEERIQRRLDGAGSSFKPSEWVLLQLAVFLLAGLVGLLLGQGRLGLGIVFLVAGALGPWLYLGFRRKRRLKAFNAILPDTLSLMSGSLSAGLSLAQSVDTIVREGAEPIAGEFRRVLVETRLGVPLEDALEGVTDRFESGDFAWVVMAIRIQREVGGNLSELLDTVAGTMRERQYLRRQVTTLSAEGRLSAYVLGGLPPFFLLYLYLTQGDYVMPLFTEPMGWMMLGGMGVLLGIGGLWMSRLVKVEV